MTFFARTRLRRELARWHATGHRPLVWWRDDDARGISPAFERLLDVADGLPLSVAVIPHGVSPTLADRLRTSPHVTVGQHGLDHVNRRQPAAGPAADYTEAVAPGPLARKILAGRDTLEQAGLDPAFYAPPWNRVEPVLLEALPIAGYFALSGWKGEGANKPGLQRLDTHLDVMRWKGGARFRGAARIETDLRGQLAARRRAGAFDNPLGLLTHHLEHDEACWTFLCGFLALLRDAVDFARFDELITD
jgi:hypothetical protein